MRFTETQQQLRSMARNFSDSHIKPIAESLDADERFPHDLYLQMGELGLFGIGVPEAYGGPDFDTVSYALAIHQ